jgi:glycogen phosphorylase
MTTEGARDLARAIRALADRLPERLWPLARVAYNYRWSWDKRGEEMFRTLDPLRYERARGNPVALLTQLPPPALAEAAHDERVVELAAALEAVTDAELSAPSLDAGDITADNPIAFVCAEFGVHRSLPIYQGGLGVLAGDILKGASDLRLPMVGVGILYSKGSFHQRLDPTGWQHDYWIDVEPDLLPAALVTDGDGQPLVVDVPIRGRAVHVPVWRVQVGRVPLYLMDANRDDNQTADRWITARLYVGDRTARLEQYALLGIGGMRVLRALGITPSRVHINEGHGAFAPIELANEDAAQDGDLDAALEHAISRTIFTTHTPVPAGNETYDASLVLEVLGDAIDGDRLRRLGSTGADDQIGITSLALRASNRANAVSRLHGHVAREMWKPLYDVVSDEDVPIGHITNGVHVGTWMTRPMRDVLDRHLGEDWIGRAGDPATWEGVDAIPDQELWATREHLRDELVGFVREADAAARLGRYEDAVAVEAVAESFDPGRLTLGFARRVATYKRLHLLFRDPARLEWLLGKDDTVQIVIAGKAHPRDTEAKARLAELIRMPWAPNVAPRIAFLEDYDMGVAARLVSGCDVWVNLPRPPMEASGTSGMKAMLNGGLNLSVLDGWWAEAFDGGNGWSVGDGTRWENQDGQDDRDASELFDRIEHELLPMFQERNDDGVPWRWVRMMKHSLKTLGPRFSADRMLRDYVEQAYSPR